MQRSIARALLWATLLVAGCAAPPSRPTFPDLRFTDKPPIGLDVTRIDVVDAYQAPFKAPNIDQTFPVPPEHALENWAHDRLQAAGNRGRAVFTIRNASVIATDLKVDRSFTGSFTDQPSQRYDLTLQATLQVFDPNGDTRSASVTTTRSQSILQSATPNDRDRVAYDMTRAAMADFDSQMATEIHNNFGGFVQ